MSIPKKLLSRKDEITTDFLQIVEHHIDELLHLHCKQILHSKDFAALLFIHPRHLTNTIKETTGKSPCDIMEERIIAETLIKLRETDMSVEDISNMFLYTESTNFIKFFKRMCGVTPLQYRKQQQLMAAVKTEECTIFEA